MTPLLSPDLQISFENFIIYLEKWYFSERSIFKKNDWNYHLKLVDILRNSQNKNKINSTTNAIESINEYLRLDSSEKNIYALQYLFKFGLKNPLAFYSTWVVNENEPEDDPLNFTLI